MGIDPSLIKIETKQDYEITRNAMKSAFGYRINRDKTVKEREAQANFHKLKARNNELYEKLRNFFGMKRAGIGISNMDKSDREIAEDAKVKEAVIQTIQNIPVPGANPALQGINIIKKITESGLEMEAEQGRDELKKRQEMRDQLDALKDTPP